MKTFYRILFAVCAVVLFRGMLACGGSGTGSSADAGEATGLTIADRISVVDAQEDATPSVSALVKDFRALQRSVPSDSDYMTDVQNIWVEERSMGVFDTINEITCMMAQTAYDEMVNLGPYVAQIEIDQCSSNQDDASTQGQSSQDQSSGSTATEYEYWTVDSIRADGASPHYVSAWVHQSGDEYEPAMDIDVLVEITEGASEANPLGLFTMNFAARPATEDAGGTTAGLVRSDEPLMRGILRTTLNDDGTVGLQFVDGSSFGSGEELFQRSEAATLFKSPDGSSGAGSVAQSETGPYGDNEMTGDFAYSSDYFLRSKGEGDFVCASRINFDETTWNYGLYGATTGERVELNSGFSIQIGEGEDQMWGWAGYYGIGLPNDLFSQLESGDTVNKVIFQSNGPPTLEPYTLFMAPGKLTKHTRHSLMLSEIVGIPLSLWRCDGETCGEYRVVFNGEQFMVNGLRDMNNYVFTDTAEEPLVPNETDWSLNFWSQALGGSVQINLHNKDTGESVAITGATPLVFYSETTVTPTDTEVPTLLVCFENCINPLEEGGDYYFDASTFSTSFEETYSFLAMNGQLENGVTHVSYGFDPVTMTLDYQGAPVAVSEVNEGQSGLWTGALIPADKVGDLTCPFEPFGTCPWMAWEVLDEYYTYETGPNSWNVYATLKDAAGAYVTFDAPLMLQYTHTTGAKYILEYNGFPNLFGIPGKCIDFETGEDVSCDTGNNRWIPEFAIADGTTVTDMQNVEYLIKGIDKEQRMRVVDTSECADAGLTTTHYELPDLSLYVEPDIGEEPDAEIAVIGGVVQ